MTDVFEEHLSYFQLPNRLELFSEAIATCIKPGDIVADLGCGFGVLGMLCLKHGAAKVYGIDSSDAIHIARETAQRSGLGDRYHCIAGSTFKTKLPERADVVICDHVGFLGYDYGIVAMLRDARNRLLKPGGTVMPQKLRLMFGAVSTKAYDEITQPWLRASTPPEFHWLRASSINTKHSRVFKADELLSDGAKLGTISLDKDGPDFVRFAATLSITSEGMFNGLAGWFDALLGGDIWMTNSPLENRSIGRGQAFLPLEKPFAVKAGDMIEVTVNIRPDDNMIAWTVQDRVSGQRQKMSSWSSAILNPKDLSQGTAK